MGEYSNYYISKHLINGKFESKRKCVDNERDSILKQGDT